MEETNFASSSTFNLQLRRTLNLTTSPEEKKYQLKRDDIAQRKMKVV
jgi:hypothetical protein